MIILTSSFVRGWTRILKIDNYEDPRKFSCNIPTLTPLYSYKDMKRLKRRTQKDTKFHKNLQAINLISEDNAIE